MVGKILEGAPTKQILGRTMGVQLTLSDASLCRDALYSISAKNVHWLQGLKHPQVVSEVLPEWTLRHRSLPDSSGSQALCRKFCSPVRPKKRAQRDSQRRISLDCANEDPQHNWGDTELPGAGPSTKQGPAPKKPVWQGLVLIEGAYQ